MSRSIFCERLSKLIYANSPQLLPQASIYAMCSIVWEIGLFFFNLSMRKGWTFLEKQCRTFLSNCFQICTSRLAANMLCLPATVTIICIFLVKWKYVLIVLNDLINDSSSCRFQLIWNLWCLLLIQKVTETGSSDFLSRHSGLVEN